MNFWEEIASIVNFKLKNVIKIKIFLIKESLGLEKMCVFFCACAWDFIFSKLMYHDVFTYY